MQPDPGLIEKQKMEQMIKRQRLEQLGVRTVLNYLIAFRYVEKEGGRDEEEQDDGGRASEAADHGDTKHESMG